MATTEKYSFLDESGVQQLAKVLLNTVNSRITERIVTTVDAKSDDKHVASAAAVYKAITSRNHVGIKTVTGDINTVIPEDERSPHMIYLQRDNAQDTTWLMYIWNADPTVDFDFDAEWICLGNTEVNLENYWSKDDVEAMKEALGINDLETGVPEDYDTIKGNVESLMTQIDDKVSKEALEALSSGDIKTILDKVIKETDIMTEGHIDADDGDDDFIF